MIFSERENSKLYIYFESKRWGTVTFGRLAKFYKLLWNGNHLRRRWDHDGYKTGGI